MADPIQSTLSLAELSRQYTVYELDQVLMPGQLNSVTDYLNDQGRLTRVGLLGIGIIGGLQVSQSGDKVTVTKGVGVTTDGDLLLLDADTDYVGFRPYGEAKPHYDPFFSDGKMRTIFELTVDVTDSPDILALAALPVKLSDSAVVMMMESYLDDKDLCSGKDCDNLGKTAIDTPRMLLMSRDDVMGLLKSAPTTVSDAAQKLPELFVTRPKIGKEIATTKALGDAYRKACDSTNARFADQLGTLFTLVPALAAESNGDISAASWVAILKKQSAANQADVGIQYYYDFLKDLADTWNDLRELLFADNSLLCPYPKAFPKHLVLGDFTTPTPVRTGLYPSPLVAGTRDEQEHARFLVRKLNALIEGLHADPGAAQSVKITPSRNEAVTLEERAIPYYYDANISAVWNFRMARRNAPAESYYGYTASGAEVFGRQIGRFDFFRIEGHLNRKVTDAKATIEKAIADNNLPFAVRAVLLHTDRKLLIPTPPRFTDLHRFHDILRSDLSLQLQNTQQFNESFTNGINQAIKENQIPDESQDVSTTTRTRHLQIANAAGRAAPTLALQKYSEYRSVPPEQDWRAAFGEVVNASGDYKSTLGERVHTDYSTPFDSVVESNHAAWLGWLDLQIQAKDDREVDKLLFQKFCEQHPALEHFGGVARGGTFILIYDETGLVVADGMLPYYLQDSTEVEPEVPIKLPPPVFKNPGLVESGFKLRPPIDFTFTAKLTEFDQKVVTPKLTDNVRVQQEYLNIFKTSVQVAGTAKTLQQPDKTTPGRNAFVDPGLQVRVDDIAVKKAQVETMRDIVVDPATSDADRKQAAEELNRADLALATAVSDASKFVVEKNIAVGEGTEGSRAISAISEGAHTVTTPDAIKVLDTSRETISKASVAAPAAVAPTAILRVFNLKLNR